MVLRTFHFRLFVGGAYIALYVCAQMYIAG